MNDFGMALRKEREVRGIALETITRVTKIGTRHLVALEEEQFQVLPGGLFNKNIVREYARVVGLNEEEWVQRFLAAYRASSSFVEDESGWIQFAENAIKGREAAQGRRPDMRLRWLGVSILLLFLTILCWSVWTYVHHKVSGSTHLPAAAPAGSSAATGAGAAESSVEKPLPGRRPSGNVLQDRRQGARTKQWSKLQDHRGPGPGPTQP